MITRLLVPLVALPVVASQPEASIDEVAYTFNCSKQVDQQYFESLGHTFVVPQGFESDLYNERSFILTVLSAPIAGSQMEIQAVFIRYGPIDESRHRNWVVESKPEEFGGAVEVRTRVETGEYGSRFYAVAFVGREDQVQFYSLIPLNWRSFLKCKMS